MFGKKNKKEIHAIHYEGVDTFSTDQPCTLEVIENTLIIKTVKPETLVTLPMDRVQSISVISENDFLQKFKGTNLKVNQKIPRIFMTIHYDKGMLVFWGTSSSYRKFIKLKENVSIPNHIEL